MDGMTAEEARRVYDRQRIIAKTFGKDIYALCEAKGVPRHLVEKFENDEQVIDRFFERHDADGEPKTPADRAAAERLKAQIRKQKRR